MGALGWAPHEVDAMEIPVVGRFLGAGGRDPVIRGSRGLTLPSDRTTGMPKGSAFLSPSDDHSLHARIAAAKAKEREAATTAAEDAPVLYEDG